MQHRWFILLMKQAVVCICNICHPFMLSSHLWSFLDDARVVVKCFEIREPYWSTITCIVIVYVCISWGLFSACQRHSRDMILLNTLVLQKDIQCIRTIYDSTIQYVSYIHVIIKGNAIYTLTLSWPIEIDAPASLSSELGTDNGQAIYRTFLKSGGTHGIQNVS